ncbi:MAG: Mov34/MPN/PAD-1 family protein [Planctomycetales bacterium]|nr:Mov34/MPN/PAD-1 family protein [Planctomycetales bacterium]
MSHDELPPFRSYDAKSESKLLTRVARQPGASRSGAPEPAPGRDENLVHDDGLLSLWLLKITQPAFRQLLEFLLEREPEAAGLLLGPANDDLLVTHFVPDLTGRGTPASFELGTVELNEVLQWMKPAGINCKGIAHSHPAGFVSPSHGDLNYLRRVFGLPSNSAAGQFYMPIVSGGRLYPYVYAQGRVWCAELVLI